MERTEKDEELLESLYDQRRQWERLRDSPDWSKLRNVMLGVVQSQRQAFFGMPLTEPVAMAEVRGQIAGIQLSLNMPTMMIEDLQQQIDYEIAKVRVEEIVPPLDKEKEGF